MDITTLDRLRAYIDEKNFLDGTSLLNQRIAAWSAQVEHELGRFLQATSRTAYIDVDGNERVFYLKGFPITSITSVTEDLSRVFTGSAISSSSYVGTTTALNEGRLELDYFPAKGPQVLKVVYVGGMAATTTALATAYPDLVSAVERQIMYEFANKDLTGFAGKGSSELGTSAEKINTAMTWFQAQGDILPEAWQAINKHRSYVPRW